MVNRLDSCQRCLGYKLEGSVERCGQRACDGKEEKVIGETLKRKVENT